MLFRSQDGTEKTAAQVLLELSGRPFPLTEYIDTADGYETQVESHFSYEEIVAMEASDEPDAADGTAAIFLLHILKTGFSLF